ncbi:hypothetical protein BC937DRAFT_93373 [Endogone sp. FLAS-F59071]|nr:hypothetical protein BC937DRAFT_93373 [Endogone sp. FLAS-F59071]|eukprot:RUS21192.1 hypothetical protein BC937DRAFT_93373 [Endogone sp. FLAS-F59071]
MGAERVPSFHLPARSRKLDAPIDANGNLVCLISSRAFHPNDIRALQSFTKKRENWSELADTLEQMLTIYQDMGDAKRLLDAINKLIDLYTNKQKDRTKVTIRKYTSITSAIHRFNLTPLFGPSQVIEKLMLLLPSSPYFTLLSSTDAQLPPPPDTWLEIARLHEVENAETITREIEARRWRLNA